MAPFRTIRHLVLASASPRRKQFLQDLGLEFTICPASIDETPAPGEEPAAFALRMATAKALAVAERFPESYVIAADTVVCLENTILGKPQDQAAALAMLRRLSNRSHLVISGLALLCRKDHLSQAMTSTTKVVFADFPKSVLTAYVRSGEPMDKAGSYAIQGKGAFLVKTIEGSCANVIGLPIQPLVNWLLRCQAITTSDDQPACPSPPHPGENPF